MNASISLGKVFGIPIRLHITWFIVFILVTMTLSLHYFPDTYPFWDIPLYWITGIITGLLFFASIIAHELSHSIVSKAGGVPVKSITLFVFGGVAQISREASHPAGELKMALAGPFSSIAIAVIFGALWFFSQTHNEQVSALAFWLMYINFSLALFNLIPGFPLDGGRVLRSIIWQATNDYKRATRVATIVGQGVAYLFILIGLVFVFTGNFANGIWLALIGWFLENAASTSYRQAVIKESLVNISASEVMSSECAVVPPDLTVKQLVNEYVLPSGRRCFMVTGENRLEGIITLKDIKALSQDKWGVTPVEKAMTPLTRLVIARPTDSAQRILELMDEGDISQVPVVDGNRVVGIIGRDNLLRLIRTRSELGI
jgi:Zn-dependent protease